MTNQDVLHEWLARRSTFGKAFNTNGKWLFSYRMPIARHSWKWKTVLILARGPTKATQSHINRAKELCRTLSYRRVLVGSLKDPQLGDRYGKVRRKHHNQLP